MIHKFSINIPTLQEIKDLKYPLSAFITSKLLSIDLWIFKRGLWTWKLMYRLTGRCGSLTNGHYPIFSNWLWTHRRRGEYIYSTCKVCGQVVKTKRAKVSFKNYSKMGRQEDMANLRRMEATATNEAERTAVKHNIHKLKFEDKKVSSMREDLIKATRDNDHKKIKEIHNYVETHKEYRNER